MLRHRLPAGPCQVTACNKKVALGETGKGLAKDDTIHVRKVLKGAYYKQECVGVKEKGIKRREGGNNYE